MAANSIQDFIKISKEEISIEFIYEDEKCVVFDEINAKASVHFAVVPRKRLPTLLHAKEEDEQLLGHLMMVAKNIALEKGLHRSGYHVRVEENYGSEMPRFFSLHVFGRALHHNMLWPIGPGCRL